uniref:RegA n=1 Tax=Streptomyces lavendulae TaxID=1914 RepID=Q6RGQ1_STRLA|nr:RegA [Streptomyces lavendulae]
MRHNDRGKDRVRIRGGRLRELRIQRGLHTQRQLAEALGCARSSVTTWEASKSVPRPAMLFRIAALLDASPDDLIDASRVKLKTLRTACGLRQSDMAEALGVAPSTYCDVERQRQAIPDRWFPILAKILSQPESAVRELLSSA